METKIKMILSNAVLLFFYATVRSYRVAFIRGQEENALDELALNENI